MRKLLTIFIFLSTAISSTLPIICETKLTLNKISEDTILTKEKVNVALKALIPTNTNNTNNLAKTSFFKPQLTKKEKQIATLQKQVNEKTRTIAKLEKEKTVLQRQLNEKDIEIATLQKQLNEKSNEILPQQQPLTVKISFKTIIFQ